VEELTALLSAYHPLPNQDDTLYWKGKKEFSAKILQQLLHMEVEVEVESLVCSVWMNLVPPKVEFFMWLTLLGKINTKELLCKKGILLDCQTLCTFCSAHTENLDHVLLNCSFSWRVWCSIADDLGQNLASHATFK